MNDNSTSRTNFDEEIKGIISSNLADDEIREELSNYHESDIADTWPELDTAMRKKLFRVLGNEGMADILAYVDDASDYLTDMDVEQAADILEQMDADDAVDVLDNVSDEEREALISQMDEEAGADVRMIYSFDDDEIGSRMTTNFIVIRKGISVKEAMKSLISQAEKNDNVTAIYVEDENEKYYGFIDLKDLIIARNYSDLEDIIITSYPYVLATEKVEDCIEDLRSYEEDSIPVLSEDHQIIGVITSMDIVEAIDDEMGDDYAKLAGLTAEEDLSEPLFESIKKRIPWLVLLLFLGIGVSSVVGIFENVVAQIALIVSFQSLILDMSGNVGTQSLAVTIRVLMDEDISALQKVKFVLKEMRIGFLNGLILGVLAFVFLTVYIYLAKSKPIIYACAISGCVGISLVTAMVISSLVGSLVPMFFHKIKVDPAVASGPLITTVNDLVAVVTYYGLSGLILIQMLNITG